MYPEAKPTTYLNVEYRSRLEARWAIFWNSYFACQTWRYEPRKFNMPDNRTYTPDFYATVGPFHIYQEVKPDNPALDYLLTLAPIVLQVKLFYLGIGDFYQGVPSMAQLTKQGIGDLIPLNKVPWLPNPGEAIKAAQQARFDLANPEQPPAFRSGSAGKFQATLNAWRTREARKNRRKQ